MSINNDDKYKQDHILIGFFKKNLFQLIGITAAVLALWGMSQTLPLEGKINLNSEKLVTVVKAVEKFDSIYETKESSQLKDANIIQILSSIQEDIKEMKSDIKSIQKEL